MRAGRLDRLIDVERATVILDDAGQPIETWAKLVSNRPAEYRPMRGDERFTAQQFVATEQVEFLVHWTSDLATLNPRDRVVYPATTETPPPHQSVYEIMGVLELGRREGLRILTARRPEV